MIVIAGPAWFTEFCGCICGGLCCLVGVGVLLLSGWFVCLLLACSLCLFWFWLVLTLTARLLILLVVGLFGFY